MRAYPVVERHRLVWVWMGDPERADPARVPDVRWLDAPQWVASEGYHRIEANYRLLNDNLLDLSHETSVHVRTIGHEAVAETPVDTALGTEAARGATTYTPGGTGVCTVDRTFPAGTGTGAITEVGLFDDPAAGNMFNRKTFAAINKTAGDALKASCTITLIAA